MLSGREATVTSDEYWRGATGARSAYGDPDRNVRRELSAQAEYRKDHIAAGLFAIFLGVFGMHKFYLGYNQTAFIMLTVSIVGSILTIGLAAVVIWVIAIIEGVLYLAKSQTDFDEIYVKNKREWF